MIGERRTLLPKILSQPAPTGAKSPILNQYSLVAPQWDSKYTDIIQLLFIYSLNGPASLNTLYAMWTLVIIDAHA